MGSFPDWFGQSTTYNRGEVITSGVHGIRISRLNQKRHLKSEFALFQFIDIFQFHLICLRNFLRLNPKGSPYLSLEKEKENFCVVFTYSINRAREIRKFHVAYRKA